MDMRVAIPEEDVSPPVMNAGLEATTRLDEQQIKRGDVPLFQDAGPGTRFVWQPEPPGAERFDHAKRVLARGWGDCDDLAPWRSASLRVTGEDPGARAVVVRSGPNRWHAIVQRSDGSLEDPSRTAGMPHAVIGGHRANGMVIVGQADDADDDTIAPPEDMAALPPVVPRIHRGHRPAVALMAPRTGVYYARADVPFRGASRYALSSLCCSDLPSQAIAGAVNSVIGWAEAAGVLEPEALAGLGALSGLCCGHDERDVASVFGAHAVRRARDLAYEVRRHGHNAHVVGAPPPHIAAAALHVMQHPNATRDERRLAALVHAHASGKRPQPGSTSARVMQFFDRNLGPVKHGSADDHARLLLADQSAKMLSQSGMVVGDIWGDIAHTVAQVAPVVAAVAPIIPGVGPAISVAALGAGAIAGALDPTGKGGGPKPGVTAAMQTAQALQSTYAPTAAASAALPSASARAAFATPPGTAAVFPSSGFGGGMGLPRRMTITPGSGASITLEF